MALLMVMVLCEWHGRIWMAASKATLLWNTFIHSPHSSDRYVPYPACGAVQEDSTHACNRLQE